MLSLLVCNQVKLKCWAESGSRLNGESRSDNMRVSRCAYGMCARTDAPGALTTHSATALKRLPEASRGGLLRDRAGR